MQLTAGAAMRVLKVKWLDAAGSLFIGCTGTQDVLKLLYWEITMTMLVCTSLVPLISSHFPGISGILCAQFTSKHCLTDTVVNDNNCYGLPIISYPVQGYHRAKVGRPPIHHSVRVDLHSENLI